MCWDGEREWCFYKKYLSYISQLIESPEQLIEESDQVLEGENIK